MSPRRVEGADEDEASGDLSDDDEVVWLKSKKVSISKSDLRA